MNWLAFGHSLLTGEAPVEAAEELGNSESRGRTKP